MNAPELQKAFPIQRIFSVDKAREARSRGRALGARTMTVADPFGNRLILAELK